MSLKKISCRLYVCGRNSRETGYFYLFLNSEYPCVRDHKFSRKNGLFFGVFPEILRHPCNCQILTHRNNVSKSRTDTGFGIDNSITLEMLFQNIRTFTGDWQEQNLCLDLIAKYERGERWNRIKEIVQAGKDGTHE